MAKRIVITGVGVVSPIGMGRDAFWQSLLAGRNGIGRISLFDPSDYSAQIAGEVKDFDPTEFIDKKEARRMDRYAQFALAAAKMAIEDAGLDMEKEDHDRMGAFVGSGIGGIMTMHGQYEKLFAKGPHFISPFYIPMMIPNMAAAHVTIAYGLHGPSSCNATACATGFPAVCQRAQRVCHGRGIRPVGSRDLGTRAKARGKDLR